MYLNYTESLSGLNQESRQYSDASSLLKIAMERESDIPAYLLVTRRGTPVVFEKVVMKDGSGLKAGASGVFNPEGVQLLLGGEDASLRTFIPTVISTTAETNVARALFKDLKKQVVGMSTYCNGSYIFPGAAGKHREGWRLTGGRQYSPMMDVVLPPDKGCL